MTRARLPSMVVVLLLGAGPACAQLGPPERDTCGNRVVEAGEDCDNPDDPRCGGAGQDGQCRILCDPTSNDPLFCGPGRQCGNDGVCRAPAGTFVRDPIQLPRAGTRWIEVGDLDGDGTDEFVVAFGDPEIQALFIDPSAIEEITVRDPGRASAAVGDLTGDGRADLFVALEGDAPPGGLSLWRIEGGPESPRIPRNNHFATLRTASAAGRLISATPEPDRILELTAPDMTQHWSSQRTDASPTPSMGVGGPALGTAVAVADLDGGACEADPGRNPFPKAEIALGSQAEDRVRIRSTCGGGTGIDWLADVMLPGGRVLGSAGTFFADVNVDGALDLVVQDDGGAVLVGYGVADGSFHSDPTVPATDGDGQLSPTPLVDTTGDPPGVLLAVADLDDDPEPELVTTQAYIGAPSGCPGACEREPWSVPAEHATVVDFNDDGSLDIAALAGDELYIHLGDPLRPGESFETHRRRLDGPARTIVTGDFNRDTIEDVAFAETALDAPAQTDERVAVWYGGAIDDWRAQRFGPFSGIETVVVEQGATLVARTTDDQDRFSGAFIRPEDPEHNFGFVAHRPVVVRTAQGNSVATVGTPGDGGPEAIHQVGFVGGGLSPHDVVSGVPLGFDPGTAALTVAVAADLDGNGADELVVLGRGAGLGQVLVARLDPQSGIWAEATRFAVGPGFARRLVDRNAPPPAGGGPGSAAAVGDADGDGDLDVLATTDEPTPRVVLLTNDAGSVGGPGAVTLEVASTSAFQVAHIAPWHADENGVVRWLVAGIDGAGLAVVDIEATTLEVDHQYRLPVVALGSGDFDGDGLLDLAYATDDQLLIYRAEEIVGGLTTP